MGNDLFSTSDIYSNIEQCDDLDEFKKEILNLLHSQRAMWKDKISQIIEDSGCSQRGFAEVCGISSVTVGKWLKGAIPRSRDHFLRIGFAAHYDLQHMNFFLQRYGCYPALYPKSLADSACIFVLNMQFKNQSYELYTNLYERTVKAINDDLNHRVDMSSVDTNMVMDFISQLETESEFEKFVTENKEIFNSAYANLYRYILAYIESNNMDYVESKSRSIHALAEDQQWTSSMRHAVSAIKRKTWFPIREKLISLGLHLNMDVLGINEMLALAQMETLCAKRPLEAAIIYSVLDAELNDVIVGDGSSDLCEYVKKVLKQLDIPESVELLRDI